ncbi:hypothetical protein OROGR_006194 [Orobanche gracilis]
MARASVLVNGSPTREFSLQKGVRQGDPLSSFLFIIAMEGLNLVMKEAVAKGVFKGVAIPGSNTTLSHLFYADDALFLGEWSKGNIKNLSRILKYFYASSGLKVNFNKSKVYGIGVSDREVEEWASPLGCEPASLPFNYLGVPVGANMNLKKNWKPVIDKFNSKLSVWKARSLSFGGRVTLAKSVLGNLPTYFLSLFAAPAGIVDSLEKIRRRFIWGGNSTSNKICWVAWDRITAPKEVGGLGLGSIKTLNMALLIKWWWKFFKESDALWVDVLKGIHGLVHPNLLNLLGIDLQVFGRTLNRLERSNHWISDCRFPWINWTPYKISCFVWRARLNRIPSNSALLSRNVSIGSVYCSACCSSSECADHLLVRCPFASWVWSRVEVWCGLSGANSISVNGWVDFAAKAGHDSKKKRKFLSMVIFATMWRFGEQGMIAFSILILWIQGLW